MKGEMPIFISQEEAFVLLKRRKGWYSDEQLRDMLIQATRKHEPQFDKLFQEASTSVEDMRKNVRGLVEALNVGVSVFQDRSDYCLVLPEYDRSFSSTPVLQFMVKPNAVFHLGKASRTVLVDGIGLFIAYAATGVLPGLLHLWFGLPLLEVARQLVRCYEKLENPTERVVFETVYRLQNQLGIRNYDAMKKRDFDQAYGMMSPTVASICSELSQLSKGQIESTLHGLERRGILQGRKGKWCVPFW